MEARNACLIFERDIVANEVLQLTPAIQVRVPSEDAPTVRFRQLSQHFGIVMQRTSPCQQRQNRRPAQEPKKRTKHWHPNVSAPSPTPRPAPPDEREPRSNGSPVPDRTRHRVAK